jgi:uncharacterized protein YndB with AHSA1/START domain
MKEPLIVRNEILIKSTSARIWNALINPEQTKKYMFGCETVSDWKKGSELLWKGNYNGQEMIFVKGTIKEIVSEKYLSYTTIDAHSSIDDVSENYLIVTYDLVRQDGQILLTVTQGDYNIVAEGERRYAEAFNNGEGWNPILLQIKELVESET